MIDARAASAPSRVAPLAGLALKIEHDLLRKRQPDTYTSTENASHTVTV
jgi:hypothetical protein